MGKGGRRCARVSFVACLALANAPSRADGETFAECTTLLARGAASREAAACFHDRAAVTGHWDAARTHLSDAAKSNPDAGWVRYYLAEITARTSSAEAVPHYRSAVQSFERRSDTGGEARARVRLGLALFRSGERQAGASESEHAVVVARRSGDPEVLALALMEQGWIALQRSDRLAGALRALREAESMVFPGGPYAMQMRVRLRLGGVLFALGQYQHARVQYMDLIEVARARGDVSTEALARSNLLTTRRREMEVLPDRTLLGEFLEDARQALSLAEATREPSRQAFAHRTLADLLVGLGAEEAGLHYRAGLEFARKANDPRELSESLWALARWLADTQPAASKRLLDEALQVAVDAGRPASVAYAWRQRMRLAWKTQPRDQAVTESTRALDAMETILELQQGEGAGAFSPWTLDYYWLTGTVLSRGSSRADLVLAFEIGERMRARQLLAAFRRQRIGDGHETRLDEQRRELLRALSDVQRRLLDPRLDGRARANLLADLERLEDEEQAVRAKLSTGHRGPPVTIASIDQVQQALEPDEAMLSFAVGLDENFYGDFGGGAWLLVISRDDVRVYRSPDRSALYGMVTVFRGLAEHVERIDARASVGLYASLLREPLQQLPGNVTRLVIVADGPLHQLPFVALRPAADGPSLGETHEIVTVPSATAWLWLRHLPPAHGAHAALVMADPVLLDTVRTSAPAADRGWWSAAQQLGPLPFARTEGRALLSRIGGRGHLLVGSAASEAAVKQADPRSYRVVHFAAHALVDEERPERSAIFLAPGVATEDGLLQAREIADLPLDGHIVVLSACGSATGAVLAGEGVLGLSRAFLEAGAATVVGTLWTIRDDHAAQFFDWFYASLGRGHTVGTALADARRAAIASGMPASAWSGVVAIGDDQRRIEPATSAGLGTSARLLTIAFGAVLLAAIIWRLGGPRRAR